MSDSALPPHLNRGGNTLSPRAFFTVLLAAVLTFGMFSCRDKKSPGAANGNPNNGVAFDGSRAFAHVKQQVDFGARPAGSAELASARAYIMQELRSYGLNVTTDEWTATTPAGAKQMVNIIATIPGASDETILITSHYDTKPLKDFKFVGANDGGSSTGVLMEIGRVLAARADKPPFTYKLVFFDGEEAFCEEWDECKNPDGSDDNTYGSRHYVAQLQAQNAVAKTRAMILLDMIGYKNLTIPRDGNSTRWLTDTIWQTASETGQGNVFINAEESTTDDHEPFLKAGIPAVDIIQLGGYEYWHTAQDTLDKISPRSLKIVGEVVIASLPKITARLQQKSPGDK